MALPNKLKDFNLFGDGESWQGLIPELTLPELNRKVEEYRAGGMDAAIEIDLGQEKIEFTWKPAGVLPAIYTHYGAAGHDSTQLRFVGSYETDEDGSGVAVEIVVRGRHKTINHGDAKPGDSNSIEVTTACSYYRLSVDGRDKIEIDVPGGVFKVDGEDRLAARRQRLGLV